MLVYGDRARIEDPRAKLDGIEAAWAAAARLPPGLIRHSALVGAFVEASELAQGLADLEFEAAGEDDLTPLQGAAMAVVMEAAREVARSWNSKISPHWGEEPPARAAMGGSSGAPDLSLANTFGATGGRRAKLEPPIAASRLLPPVGGDLGALARLLPGTVIRTKQAEGHAFYALYPEAYLEAARTLPSATRVVGLRSIGAGLAAMAAVGAGGKAPFSLRPVGHPFRREIRASARLRASVAAPAAAWAIADEGPGLSGSSFGAAADWLEAEGVPASRIVFLPSHAGDPGPEADPAHLRRWTEARRLTADFDDLTGRAHGAVPPLAEWFADRTGEPLAPLEDLSAGAWRARWFADEASWPPAHAGLERRKYLLRTDRGAYLLKFAGLGREDRAKLDRARALHHAGCGVEPVDLRHGFLAERWRDDARPLREGETVPVESLAAYLSFRANAFPADAPGASLIELARMARVNAEEALGSRAVARLAWTDAELAELQHAARPILIDGRLHRWEWLLAPEGRLLKTDALDHAGGHDLVGAQDLAWDLAGAAVEFDLSEDDVGRLLALCGYDTGEGRALYAMLTPCYLAFQLGLWTLAADADDGRPAALAGRYAATLERRIAP
ncbi:hypothetical protein [Caulobacter sp. 17J80-11]|uniref:hypothetical protein n=1 Tax=Caulobacter sp. 17J80-11 TaxID=2763502 RepID=UPI001653E85D|nr:hypothetical protein [Caulobacter sp. 17J80-11]MBC6982695.1 hypothetical protein [Caulobacter sp. 17J80-11]